MKVEFKKELDRKLEQNSLKWKLHWENKRNFNKRCSFLFDTFKKINHSYHSWNLFASFISSDLILLFKKVYAILRKKFFITM